ncbi:MAG: hypothetical protein VR72_01860 [Clostridiaceae bacterium BRH_c20a]|nr:MAG: hypothetical protein VR72_01860 [Clostridiaceae bacterium BRH_c20a]
MVHSIPWYIVLTVSIPETFLCLSLGFSLFNVPVNNKDKLILSILAGISSYIIRKIPLLFGVHTFIFLIFLVILTRLLCKIGLIQSVICILAGMMIVGILQSITSPLIIDLSGINVNEVSDKPWINLILFLPSGLIMTLLYYLIKKFNLILYDLKIYYEG